MESIATAIFASFALLGLVLLVAIFKIGDALKDIADAKIEAQKKEQEQVQELMEENRYEKKT